MAFVAIKFIVSFTVCSLTLFLNALQFHNFDSKIRYYRIDPSLKEWEATFSSMQHSIGSVHIWMSCVNKKIRGIIHIESISDFDRHLDDTASYSKLDWERSASKFNVYLSGEKVRIIYSQMPWNRALSSTSVFYHDFFKIGENEFFELRINNWQRVHMINLSMLTKSQAVTQNKRQVILSVNFADKSNHQNFYQSIKPHVIYHEASQQIYKYQLIVREHELHIIKNDEFIVNAVNRGFLTIFVKPNYLPQVKDHSFRWQAVLENLSLLYYWMENVALLFVDIDEFVVSSQPLLHAIKETDNCLSIDRVHIYCSSCSRPDKLNILKSNSKWTKVIGDPKFDHPKLLVNPDKTECIYVHWSVCGQDCMQLPQETAFIFHFINYFQHRSHALSSSNATKVELSSEFLREFEKSTTSTRQPDNKGIATVRNLMTSNQMTFHLIWTTGAEHFQNWRLFILLSILRTHRQNTVVIHLYTNTLSLQFLSQLPDADKLNLSTIVFVPIDKEFFRNSPLETWVSQHPEFSRKLVPSSEDNRYSHLSDLIRLVALWRYGGVYLDFDMLLLRSLDRFSNSFACQKDLADKRITDSSDPLNFAVAVFSKGHTFLKELMRMVPGAYDPSCWPCLGPKLISQLTESWPSKSRKVLLQEHLPTEKMLDDNSTISVFPSAWFYPIYWKGGASLVQRKSNSMHEYKRVIHTAVTLHIWSHASNFSVIQSGSVLDLLILHFRLNLPLSGYGNSWDNITLLQQISHRNYTALVRRAKKHASHSHRAMLVSTTEEASRITLESEDKNEGEFQCFDFNALATVAYRAGISADTIYTCPLIDTAGKTCAEKGRKIVKNVEDVQPQSLLSQDVLIFLTVGKRTDVTVLNWWLSLLNTESIHQRVSSTVILVAEGCNSGQERSTESDSRLNNCADNVVSIMRLIISAFKSIRFSLLRLTTNYRTNSALKFQSIAKAIFGKYPNMKYYIKMDEDAVLLPDRLHTFLNTLHAVTLSDIPISFGALKPTGTDGRIVHGMNNAAMNLSANWVSSLYNNNNGQSLKTHISFVHCGGFFTMRGSRPSEWELRRSISYTQPQRPVASWLNSQGKLLKEFYQDKNEWVVEFENDFKRHCVDFNDIGKLALKNGLRSDDLYVCPLVQRVVKGACQEQLRLKPLPPPSSSLSVKNSPTTNTAFSLKPEDVLVFVAVGRKHLKSEVPALFWWLSLLDKEPPSRRVTSEVVLIADSCKEDIPHSNSSDYRELLVGNCSDNAFLLQQSLSTSFPSIQFHLSRIHAIHRTNLALKFVFGAKSVYNRFPLKKYYFKVDDDTVVFPSRLASFLLTLEVGTSGGGTSGDTPLYFGTVHDKLPYTIDWAQGGSGYGMNNKAMKLFAYSEPPADHFGFGTSEDYNLWRALSKEAVQLIHCGGFFANTVNNTNDWHFRNTITFHRVKNSDWLKRFSEVLITNYRSNPTAKKGFIDTF